jgi:hypothetical protein
MTKEDFKKLLVEEELPENIDNVLIKILCEPHPPAEAAQPPQKEPFTMVTLGYYYKCEDFGSL